MNSAYWNSQYNYYMANKPPAPESYYNQSFVDKINKARKDIDSLVAEKNKSWSAIGQKEDDYKAFYGSMSQYGEVYKNSKAEFGIEEAQDTYEQSKKALALAESTLSALPSTINGASNRVLTQSQREQRYNILADRHMAYTNNLMAKTSAYEEVWKEARQQQAEYAKAQISQQWKKLDDFTNAWRTAGQEYMNAGEKELQARELKREYESDYRNWQHQQYQNAQTIWFNNMSAALDRYIQALNTEMVMRQTQREIDNANRNGLKSWDFGGGYTMTGASGKNAVYSYNGKTISAGQFIEATGANGVNWNKWNDVWNSGVRTKGVGSDTLEAFNRRSSADSKYAYLFY